MASRRTRETTEAFTPSEPESLPSPVEESMGPIQRASETLDRDARRDAAVAAAARITQLRTGIPTPINSTTGDNPGAAGETGVPGESVGEEMHRVLEQTLQNSEDFDEDTDTSMEALENASLIQHARHVMEIDAIAETSELDPLIDIDVAELEDSEEALREHILNMSTSGMTSTSRFSAAPWITYNQKVCVFGCGGIGSWLTFFLAKSLPNADVVVSDFDDVEIHNLAGQLFSMAHIGMQKTEAIKNIGVLFGAKISTNGFHVAMDSIGVLESRISGANLVFSAFDNLLARKILFETCVLKQKTFVDGRLRATMFEVFYVDTTNLEAVASYRETLVDDSLVEDEACSFKQTAHVAAMIGAYMTSIATTHASNFVKNQKRPIPFYTSFLVTGFMFKKMKANEYTRWRNP